MQIHTIEGDDDINKAFTSVMENTLYTLYSEGTITGEQATEFVETHIVQLAKKSVFTRLFTAIGATSETKVLISRVSSDSDE